MGVLRAPPGGPQGSPVGSSGCPRGSHGVTGEEKKTQWCPRRQTHGSRHIAMCSADNRVEGQDAFDRSAASGLTSVVPRKILP